MKGVKNSANASKFINFCELFTIGTLDCYSSTTVAYHDDLIITRHIKNITDLTT